MDDYQKPSQGIFVPVVSGIVGSLLLSYAVSKAANVSTIDPVPIPSGVYQEDLEDKIDKNKEWVKTNGGLSGGLLGGESTTFKEYTKLQNYNLEANDDFLAVFPYEESEKYGYVFFEDDIVIKIKYAEHKAMKFGSNLRTSFDLWKSGKNTITTENGTFTRIDRSQDRTNDGEFGDVLDKLDQAKSKQ